MIDKISGIQKPIYETYIFCDHENKRFLQEAFCDFNGKEFDMYLKFVLEWDNNDPEKTKRRILMFFQSALPINNYAIIDFDWEENQITSNRLLQDIKDCLLLKEII